MDTSPPARETTSSGARQGTCVLAVLFGVMVVFLAQRILERVVRQTQQGFAPPGSNVRTLAASTLVLPTLQMAVCILFLFPWALLGDCYGPRLPYVGDLFVWALGVFAGSWLGSAEFLLTSYALQTAGVAAVFPAALAVITNAQSCRDGFLTGLVIAFPALLHLPGSLIAGLMARSMDWRAALLLISVVTVPPLILGWLTIPSDPAGAGPGDGPTPEGRPGRGRTAVQTLLLGAVLFGLRVHLELAFSTHYDQLTLSGAAGYFRAHNGLVNFPSTAGLAAGFVVGAMIAGGHTNTWLAWLIVATGVGIASIPLLPFDIAVLTGVVLASAGFGIGLSGRLVALLCLAAGSRISRVAAPFQVAQNLDYGVGIGVPMALILALGDTVTPDARVHLLLGRSLILLVTELVLALRKPRNRVAAQRDSEE